MNASRLLLALQFLIAVI